MKTLRAYPFTSFEMCDDNGILLGVNKYNSSLIIVDNLDRITREIAVCMYVLLDTIATFYGFYIVDYFMPSVSANTISLTVLALVFALFGISDIKKKE